MLALLPVTSTSTSIVIRDYCKEGTLLQVYGDLSVYIVERHVLYQMKGVQDMNTRNRDFSEVNVVTRTEMHLLKHVLVDPPPNHG